MERKEEEIVNRAHFEAMSANKAMPSLEELEEITGEPMEDLEKLTSMEQTDDAEKDKYRQEVLSDPKKVKIIRAELNKQKTALDMNLILINRMFPEIEDEDERSIKQEEKRLEVMEEYAKLEIALYTTRKNGKFMKSKAYEFTPHIGLNRRQRRQMFKK